MAYNGAINQCYEVAMTFVPVSLVLSTVTHNWDTGGPNWYAGSVGAAKNQIATGYARC